MLTIDLKGQGRLPEVWTEEDDGEGVRVRVRWVQRPDGAMRVAEVRAID